MTLLIGLLAALAEIAGCYAVWGVVRLYRPLWWLLPAVVSLAAFAALTTQFDAAFAGRAYAAYGGIYIATAILWLLVIEGRVPDRWDLVGAGLSIGGAAVILLGRR